MIGTHVRPIWLTRPTPRRPLYINLDVNKTMIISDVGVDVPAMINSILSEITYGIVDKTTGKWTIHTDGQVGGISYTEFLENRTKSANPEEKDDYKKEEKVLKNTFTDIGQPGNSRKKDHDSLLNILKIQPAELLNIAKTILEKQTVESLDKELAVRPIGQLKELAKSEDKDVKREAKKELDSINGINKIFDTGYRFILPSIFNLIRWVVRERPGSKFVIRTFGYDGPKIVRELNLFFKGEHPFEVAPINADSPKVKEYIMTKRERGEYKRTDTEDTLTFTESPLDGKYTEAVGAENIYKTINDIFKAGHSLIETRDDFEYWNAHKKEKDQGNFGKLIYINREKIKNDPLEPLPIFFDDNIMDDKAGIVDVRDIDKPSVIIPFKEVRDIYAIKAEPYEAIRDPNYFITKILKAEALLDVRQ